MRRLRRAVATVVGVTLLAACGGSPDASPAPTTSPVAPTPSTPTASPSTPPAPPERPAEVSRRNEAGAVATVRWFLASMNYAGASGDTAPFRKTYTDFCTRCEAIADGIDETYAAGGSITGGAWTPTDFEFYGTRGQIGFIDAAIDYAPQTLVASGGATPNEATGARGTQHAFQLRWIGRWTVAALDPDA